MGRNRKYEKTKWIGFGQICGSNIQVNAVVSFELGAVEVVLTQYRTMDRFFEIFFDKDTFDLKNPRIR